MDTAPTLSVVIAYYSCEDYIIEAVSSVLAQTRQPDEVIICDDGSPDDLHAALGSLADRVTLFRQPNAGVAAARNAAIRRASSEVIVLLDCDDYWAPNRLELISSLFAADPGLELVTSDAYIVDADGEVQGKYYSDGEVQGRYPQPFPGGDHETKILATNFVYASAAFKRGAWERVGAFDEALAGVDDWDLWIRMILSGSRVGFVPEPTAFYRVHGASYTLTSSRSMVEKEALTLEKSLALNLSAAQRRIAEGKLRARRKYLRSLNTLEAIQEVQRGGPAARTMAWRCARDRTVPLELRAKLFLAGCAPRLAHRLKPGERAPAPQRPT